MAKINYYINTYGYFKQLNPNLNSGMLLDYGSNYGRFLDSSKGEFAQESYTGVDIDIDALDAGKLMFPRANFIYYNRFNHAYNPSGEHDVWPILPNKYSTIISYSVFTHTTQEDMIDTIRWLYNHLEDNGKLIVSYASTKNEEAIRFYTKNQFNSFETFEWGNNNVIYVSDNFKDVSTPKLGKMYFTFYNLDYLKDLLKDYTVEFFNAPPNIKNCFQECLVVTKQ